MSYFVTEGPRPGTRRAGFVLPQGWELVDLSIGKHPSWRWSDPRDWGWDVQWNWPRQTTKGNA